MHSDAEWTASKCHFAVTEVTFAWLFFLFFFAIYTRGQFRSKILTITPGCITSIYTAAAARPESQTYISLAEMRGCAFNFIRIHEKDVAKVTPRRRKIHGPLLSGAHAARRRHKVEIKVSFLTRLRATTLHYRPPCSLSHGLITKTFPVFLGSSLA